MSNIDIRALRGAAEKAGSDKWQVKKINGDFYVIRNGSYEKQYGITSYQPIAEIEHKPVRDYVAAANPATVLALLDELEAKEKRIAELEAREVVLPQRYSMLHRVDFDEPYHTEMVYKQHQVLEALHDAGVNVAAAGKGE
ncbi:ead/Ea22-like family protein [Enterobacter hormaechei subsp. hoffmannii]